ncbi:MAG: DNA polymerase ligase N-terminal domain-containing protein [Phycisphaerae bacterium]
MHSRYVILHHQAPSGEHWDLMLESGDALLTWQLKSKPVSNEALPIEAEKIADHRKAYLEYEGPISGHRGHVTRVDRGELTILESGATEVRFELSGKNLTGVFRLRRDGARWIFERAAD